jgi:hypothetical protein
MEPKDRIQALKDEAARLSGGEMKSFGIDDLPPRLAEEFLQRVIAFENAPTTTNFAQLTADGVPLPAPADVSDRDLGVVLWRVIFALARRRTFLEHTNHLSDRELYTALWDKVLRSEIDDVPDDPASAWHVGIPGDDEHATAYLTYYATEEQRQRWIADFPDCNMPPHQHPQYDRDNDLPLAHDPHPHYEAREWLLTRTNPSALATNRFHTTENALKFVDALYQAGASCVAVDHIDFLPHDNGEPYADELLVVLPRDQRRSQLFELIEHEGHPDTVDGEEDVIDHGQPSVQLWWD